MTNSINGVTVEKRSAIDDQAHSHCTHSAHDIRAYLAITNGFTEALEISLTDLVSEFKLVLNSEDAPGNLQNLDKLEGDCRFCLSRISRSLALLSERINKVTLIDAESADNRSEINP